MNLTDWDMLRRTLRDLHRALVERASRDYVYAHQRLTHPSPGELLQMLIKDAEFDWLRGLSDLIVHIDVARDEETRARDALAVGIRAAVERYISPPKNADSADEFAKRYWPYVQADPSIGMAHAAVKQAISSWPRVQPSHDTPRKI